MCSQHTVEQMVDGFMGAPSWESGKSEGGQMFVNVEGDISYADKLVRGKIQFLIKGNEFSFNAFEMNNVPSPNLIAVGLLRKMCDSVN